MSGGAVDTLIEKSPEHRIDLEQALAIAKGMCRGLEFAHSRDVVHRTLKPVRGTTRCLVTSRTLCADSVGSQTGGQIYIAQ